MDRAKGESMISNSPAADDKKPVVIAIYARKSNDENLMGEVTSLDAQTGCCRSYIQIQKEKGWVECSEKFEDPNESGKDLRRPSMKRLLRAVAQGRVNGVIVYKLDRLTRNRKDFDGLLELFEKHNVALISATESLDTKSPQGRLMVSMLMQFAQYSRELDVERSKDFHLARAKKGLWCGGLAPLGYDLKEKLLVINEDEAKLVRRIFELYIERQSTFRVADELNRRGYRRKVYTTEKGEPFGGKSFDPDTIVRILQRKVYIGFVTNDRTGLEFPGQHKPIVDPQVFETAQRLLKSHNVRERAPSEGRNKHGFLFKGLIRCGECDSAMVSIVQPKKARVYLYYKCIGKVNGLPARCAVGTINAKKVEENLVERLAAIGYDRPLLERVIDKVNVAARRQLGPLENEKREIHGQLSSLEQKARYLLSLAGGADGVESAKKELRELEAAKATLEARMGELDAKIGFQKKAVFDVDVIQGVLQRFARFIYRLPPEMQARTMRLLFKQVRVYKDRITAELHELPIADLQRALDVKVPFLPKSLKPRRCRHQQGSNVTFSPDEARTTVHASEENWRGRRDSNPRSPP